jgi:hypothetical protein
MELSLNFIPFVIQVGNFDGDRSLDHRSNAREAWTVFPAIFFVLGFSNYLRVHVYVIVFHIQLKVFCRWVIFHRFFLVKVATMEPHIAGCRTIHCKYSLCDIDLIS